MMICAVNFLRKNPNIDSHIVVIWDFLKEFQTLWDILLSGIMHIM